MTTYKLYRQRQLWSGNESVKIRYVNGSFVAGTSASSPGVPRHLRVAPNGNIRQQCGLLAEQPALRHRRSSARQTKLQAVNRHQGGGKYRSRQSIKKVNEEVKLQEKYL